MLVQRIEDFIQNNDSIFPLTVAYKNGSRFYSDFIAMIKTFEANLFEKEQDNIYNKIATAYSINDVQVYLQCNCELMVLYYILRKFNTGFKYEPKYNGNYNPECSFEHKGVVVNIEVKTPNYSKRIAQENSNSLKFFAAERIPDKQAVIEELSGMINLDDTDYEGVEELSRLDNKLKDYLEHSQKKFPNGDDYFNILVIVLQTISDLDEWYSYIFGEKGAFTESSFIESNYENVDSILLCSPINGIIGGEKYYNTNVWYLEKSLSILLFDDRKAKTNKVKLQYYANNAIYFFGAYSRSFFDFTRMLSEYTPDSLTKEEYAIYKQIDLAIISEYYKYLQNKNKEN